MLLVEDNEDDVFFTRRAFSAVAPQVIIDAVSKGEDAIIKAATANYDIAVVDYKLPDMDGMEVLMRIASRDLPVIIATGLGDERTAVQALKSGAEDYIVKEEGYLRHLPQAVLGAVKRSRLDKENRRLMAETARQASLLEAVLETDPGAIAVLHGPQLLVQVANPSFRALSPALLEANVIGQSVRGLLATADMAVDLCAESEKAFNTRSAAHFFDTAISFPQVEEKYFHVHILPLNPDAPDEERDVALILWDTTREVEARRRAEAQRAWLQAVIDQMPSGVYIVSAPDGRLLFTNAAADELFGPPPVTNITDRNTARLFRATNPDGSEIEPENTGFMQVLATRQPIAGRQIRHLKPDGTVVDVLSNTAPLFDTRGNMIAAVSVFQDITQLKQVERIKDDFISIAGHELRTPLTSLKAAGQLLARRARQNSYQQGDVNLINILIQQADRMTRLIEELLDVSQIQSGKLQLRPEIFDLSKLAGEVNEMSSLSHPGYRHLLVAGEPVWVDADRDRVAQVLTNLVDNAIKYNQSEGLVEVTVKAEYAARVAHIQVRDNGTGFAPEQSEVMFERFARLGTVANHSRGMGLGLFICRQIIEAHGGTITARSEGPGKGATFTVTLPLAGSREEE